MLPMVEAVHYTVTDGLPVLHREDRVQALVVHAKLCATQEIRRRRRVPVNGAVPNLARPFMDSRSNIRASNTLCISKRRRRPAKIETENVA
jgi:hypothetical protein